MAAIPLKGITMLRSSLVCAGLSLAVLAATFAYGCGGETDENTDDPAAGNSIVPPEKPADGVAGDGDGVVLAVHKLFLGDTDRSGSPSPTAWKQFGYNLDGKISKKTSTDLCKPNKGAAPSSIYPDGNGGIDNAFGKLLLPIITGLAQDAAQQVNENIQDGTFTIMTSVEKLGSGKDYVDLHTRLYVGGDYAEAMQKAPAWDGSDEWPVVPELLDDPNDITSSKIQFPKSYVADNTWVSGTPGNLDLALSVAGFTLTLTISKAVITMEMNEGHTSASNGVIAGVLNVEVLIEELRKVAGSFDPGLCTGTTFDSLADQIRQASDILADGTQDPTKTCDAISIGLGFESKLVKLGAVGEEAEPAEDPCATGGQGPGGSGPGGSAPGGSAPGGGGQSGGAGGSAG